MKHLAAVLICISILLSGCGDIRKARARAIDAETRRNNEIHQWSMGLREGFEPFIYVLGIIGTAAIGLVMVSASGAGSFYLVGSAYWKVKRAQLQFAEFRADRNTGLFPVIIYADGRRMIDPNTGEITKLLADPYQASDTRILARTKVQVAGLLPNDTSNLSVMEIE